MPGTSVTPLATARDTDHISGESWLCRRKLTWFGTVIAVNGTTMTKISAAEQSDILRDEGER
jgi:hypothetical protein